MEGARVLDLFAGTGALGIEPLSRGAERALFVDTSYGATTTIKDNLARTGFSERARVVRKKVARFLGDASEETDERYDLILADPPYDTPARAIDALVSGLIPLLSGPGSALVLTRPTKAYTPVVPVNLLLARRLRYGDSLILVYREV